MDFCCVIFRVILKLSQDFRFSRIENILLGKSPVSDAVCRYKAHGTLVSLKKDSPRESGIRQCPKYRNSDIAEGQKCFHLLVKEKNYQDVAEEMNFSMNTSSKSEEKKEKN